jgi:hypothetical protein
MRKLVRLGLAVLVLGTVAAGVFFAWAYRAARQVPEFYAEALAAPPAKQKEAGDRLEREVLQLHNEVRQPGRWEARFTQEHINGWLAADLPAKFPGALPAGVADPRVKIEQDAVNMAVRYQQGEDSMVLSVAGEVFLTERPNEVAVRVHHVRAGAIPVPLGHFLETIAQRATSAGLPLRWSEVEGDPVALVTLPLDRDEFRGKRLQVEQLELREGEIVISGCTEPAKPQEPPQTAERTAKEGASTSKTARGEGVSSGMAR